jgi:hypothetical protein
MKEGQETDIGLILKLEYGLKALKLDKKYGS